MSRNEHSFQAIPFPANRQPVLETLETWAIKHPIHGLLEVDVTAVRRVIRHQKTLTGEGASFTGFIIACVGRAVGENRAVHAMRNRRNELVLFDDVDLTTIVEVTKGDQKFPITHIIRSANRKTFKDIHEEIRAVQARAAEGSRRAPTGAAQLFRRLPPFARRLFYNLVKSDPHWMKKNVGTVALTAVGMFGKGGGWAIPLAVTPLFITLGGIAEKPGVVQGQIVVREYLDMTLTFDHDVIDGAPAARFASHLKELIEAGPELFD